MKITLNDWVRFNVSPSVGGTGRITYCLPYSLLDRICRLDRKYVIRDDMTDMTYIRNKNQIHSIITGE